jgi:hypothetical protein
MPQQVLGGFLTGSDGETRGRPTWVAWAADGSLLVSDDTGGVIWRVIAPDAQPSVGPKPVVTARMPPQRELSGDPRMRMQADFKSDGVRVAE